jgi:hypothetical protein
MDERITDLEKLAESLAPMSLRMEAMEGRLGVVETRLGTVESQFVQLRTEMRVEFSAVRADIAAQGVELTGHIRETQREMRVLHEEVVSRIALIGEGRRPEGP